MTAADARPRSGLYLLLIGASVGAAVLGFAREALLGALFGASRQSDAFYAALAVPFWIAYFLVGGALAPALVAAMSERLVRGDLAGARAVFGAALRWVGGGLALASLALAVGAPVVARLLVPGFSEAETALTARLLTALVAYGFLTALAQLLTAALLAGGAYRTPALAVCIANGVAIAVLFVLARRVGIEAAAWSLDASGAVLVVSMLPALSRLGLLPDLRARGVRLPFRDAGLLVTSLCAAGAVDILERPLASMAGVGAVALLAFGSKLVHLPARMFAAPLASVAFPRLVRSRERGRGDGGEAGETGRAAFALLLFAAGTTAGAAPAIAAATFGRGRFDASAVAALARVLGLLAPAVVAIGLLEIVSKYLLAAGRARSVALAQGAGLATYLAFAPFLRGWGVEGLAVARDLAWCVAAAGVVIAFERQERGASLLEGLPAALCGAAVAALLAGAASHVVTGGTLVSLAASGTAAALGFLPFALTARGAGAEPRA